jgi:hypothetical protein
VMDFRTRSGSELPISSVLMATFAKSLAVRIPSDSNASDSFANSQRHKGGQMAELTRSCDGSNIPLMTRL